MFYDDRVDNLKRSRDYSLLTETKAPTSEGEDGDWSDGDRDDYDKNDRSNKDRRANKGGWGGFFGAPPKERAAERLAELRARAEQERLQKELDKRKAERIAASKNASVSGSASATSQKSGATRAGSGKSPNGKYDAIQKVQDLEKHSRAQMLKQARDFSDLLGTGGPVKPQTPEPRKPGGTSGSPAGIRRDATSQRHIGAPGSSNGIRKAGQTPTDREEHLRKKLNEVRGKGGAAFEARRAPVHSSSLPPRTKSVESKSSKRGADSKADSDRGPTGGFAISGLATITTDGALVANHGISLEDAKRLKKGAGLLGMKLYFEAEDKARLKQEKLVKERGGVAASARVSGEKDSGGRGGGVPRNSDEERRRKGGVVDNGTHAKVQRNGFGKPHSGGIEPDPVRKAVARCGSCDKPESAGARFQSCRKCKRVKFCSAECQKEGWKTHRKDCRPLSSHGVQDRALGGPARGSSFEPYRGQLKRKRPEEELDDADDFLDEGEVEDEEGPSREAVSSMIRKMFRYDPHKYVIDDRDDRTMEVGFKTTQAEELRSTRIAREEDEREAERLELEEKRRDEKRKKKAALKGKFVDD